MPLTWAGGGAEVLVGLLLAQLVDHGLVALGNGGRIVPAAHLVGAHLHCLGDALGRRPVVGVLEAPALAVVNEDAPVGAGSPLEAEALAQELGDLVLGEAGAHELAVLHVIAEGDGVGGHDGAGGLGLALELEAAVHEWNHASLEVVAGVDGVLAAVGVALAATLACALNGPVLDHGSQGLLAPARVVAALVHRGLHAVDEGADGVAREGGVLAEGAGEARPAGIGGYVALGAEEHVDAHLAQVAGLAATRLTGDLGIKGGSECQVAGPVGGVPAGPRVGREVDGDLVLGGLGVGLHVVCPLGLLEGGVARGGIEHGTDAAVQELLLLVGDGAVVLDLGLVLGEAHEAIDLLQRDALRQVSGALLGAQAPVLVRHELARALEVLEGVAVLLDELEAGLRPVGELLAVAVVDDHVAILGLGLGVARALGLGALRGGLGLGRGVAAASQAGEACRNGRRRHEAPTRDLACHVFLPFLPAGLVACPS